MQSDERHGAGGNASAHTATTMSARKLEESDEMKHDKVDKSLSKAIQQARMAKKMTQKDLATAINEKPQVIGEYENGKAIPNGQIIAKIERKLGVNFLDQAKIVAEHRNQQAQLVLLVLLEDLLLPEQGLQRGGKV